MKAKDHQAAELLQHAINGLLYASPRSLVITLQHFCRVQDAVAARRHQHGSNGSSGSDGGCWPVQPASWPLGVRVDGHVKGEPDLSSLQGVMQVGGAGRK